MTFVASRETCFTSVKQVVKRDPGMQTLVGAFEDRISELFRTGVSTYDPSTPRCGRELVPLVAAGSVSPIITQMIEKQLDFVSQEESEKIRIALRDGFLPYVPTVVVGAGVNGSAFAASYLEHSCQGPVLCIEQSSKLGGQFRQHGGPAININSANGPIKRDTAADSEYSTNCNFLGEHVPFQVSQLTGDFFPSNDVLGLAVALNQYFSARTLLGFEVISYEVNQEPSKPGRTILNLRDRDSRETFQVLTDNFIVASGAGVENISSAVSNQATRLLIAEEHAKPVNERRVLSYFDTLTHFADSANLFPREKFAGKKVVLIGGGHGALTVAEALFGLGPSNRGSVAALGGPDSVVIIGSKAEHAEGFLDVEYERYGRLAVLVNPETPKPGAKPSVLTLISASRAHEIVKTEDGFTVTIRKKDGSQEFEQDADIIIITAGFEESSLPFESTSGGFRYHLCCGQKSLLATVEEIQEQCRFLRFNIRNGVQNHELSMTCHNGEARYYDHIFCDQSREITKGEFEKAIAGGTIHSVTAINQKGCEVFVMSDLNSIEEQLQNAKPGSSFILHGSSGATEFIAPAEPDQSITLPEGCYRCCFELIEGEVQSLPVQYLGGSSRMLGRIIPGVGYVIGPAAKIPLDNADLARRDVLGAPGITLSIANNTSDAEALGKFVAESCRSSQTPNELWDAVLRNPQLGSQLEVEYVEISPDTIAVSRATTVSPLINQGEALILGSLGVERYLREAEIDIKDDDFAFLSIHGDQVHVNSSTEDSPEVRALLARIASDLDVQDILAVGYILDVPLSYQRFQEVGITIRRDNFFG